MVRFIIIGVVLGVAFTLFTVVDAAMSDPKRSRGVGKHVWVLLCVILPVIGGILWLTLGKGPVGGEVQTTAPDDDPRFGAMNQKEMDKRIADLETQLRNLDDEVFPGEDSTDDSTDPNPDKNEK
ncbi:MAG TPA: PLD nuclease N-terminal domain-containing protein [Microbacteriaceae bacterium]|nr:PLD nuclease N-terminal domain-containing protein [Microbacteriaceae bacterium]